MAVRAFPATQGRGGPAEGHARPDTHVRHGRRPPRQRTGFAGVCDQPAHIALCDIFQPCSTWPHAPLVAWLYHTVCLCLQAGFKELFGDRFVVDVVDLATQHSPYPFNQASKSYNTMVSQHVSRTDQCSARPSLCGRHRSQSYNLLRQQVKYPFLWRLGYTFTQPRIVHVPVQHVMGLIMGRQISEAFDHYQPDLVVSVHPLMQVPFFLLLIMLQAYTAS